MNSLSGHIENIEVNGSLSIVTVRLNQEVIVKAIVIETPQTATYLKTAQPIQVLFKETEVVIGLDQNHAISLQNKISGTITDIEAGVLISKVIVDTAVGEIVSIISTNAVRQLGLQKASAVCVMVKLNEVMLLV